MKERRLSRERSRRAWQRMATALISSGCLISGGCKAPQLQGAELPQAPLATAPTSVAVYETTGCVDADGEGFPVDVTRVLLLRGATGPRLRVVRADGVVFDVVNFWTKGGELVFQSVLSSAAGRAVLLDFRLPQLTAARSGPSTWGRMALADHWAERDSAEADSSTKQGSAEQSRADSFRATIPRAVVACWLRPTSAGNSGST